MPRILIADDSRFQVTLLKKGLESKGFEVVAAEDALQAGMFALRTAPDAIILDLSMPGGSGMEVLKRLKHSTKTNSIPVIIITGNDDPDLRSVASAIGAADFFHKPVDLDQLGRALSGLLAHAGHDSQGDKLRPLSRSK
jgi:DNA-binding response OmpR family regulator